MCYGPRTNAEFVVNSGFFYDKNPIGRLKIRLGYCFVGYSVHFCLETVSF